MSAFIPALAKSRTRVDPSVFRHVLQLVQAEYLPACQVSNARRSYSSASSTAILSTDGRSRIPPAVITASRPVRRHAAAAQALEEDQEDQYHLSRPESSSAPGPSYTTLDRRRSKFPRRTEDVAPSWSHLPLSLSAGLSSNQITTPAEFRSAFEELQCQSGQLARITTLDAVFNIFLQSAEPSQWAWLSGQIGHMLAAVAAAGRSVFHYDIAELGNAMRVYCLVELGQMEEARTILDAMSEHASLALVHGVKALALLQLEDTEGAKREMIHATRRGMTRTGHFITPAYLACVRQYTQQASQEDTMEVMRNGGEAFLRFFLNNKTRPTQPDFVKVWFDWLVTVPASISMADNTWQGRLVQRIHFPLLARKAERSRDGLELFIHLKNNNGLPRLRTSDELALFRNLVDIDQVQAAMFVFNEIRHIRPLFHMSLSACLVHLSTCKSEVSEEAETIWNVLLETEEPTDTDRLAIGMIRAGRGDLAGTLDAVRNVDVSRPDSHFRQTRNLLRGAVKGGFTDEAIHYLKVITGLKADIKHSNTVLQMLLRNKEDNRATELYENILSSTIIQPNKFTFTSMIGMYARRRDPAGAQAVLEVMKNRGLELDASTWSAVLNAHVESSDWAGVVRTWQQIPEDRKRQDSVVATGMKAMVLKASPFSPVLSMFRDIEKPTAYHWALVLQSASDNRDLEATDALFHEMRSLSEQSTEAVKPTVYTWSILLHAYLRTHDAKRSQAVYDDMLASGIIPSSVTYSMIISSYAGGGQSSTLERAEAFAMSIHRMINDPNTSSKILEEHGSRGQVHENLFSPLVVAAGQAGNPNLAGEYFDRVAEKETPSIPLFTQYLDAWRKAGDLHMVRSIWAELFALACRTVATGPTIPDRRSSPTRTPDNALCIPLSIVLITYGKEKRLLDIKETWESVRKAGFGFDVGNFNHLAVSLAQSGDVEGAFDVMENVLLESDEAVGVIPRRESTLSATDPASRPPNRRAEQQSANYDTLQRELDPSMLSLTMNAKSDTIWRPHFHTIATLDSLVSQLEDSRTGGPYRAWMGALAEEGEEDGDLEVDGAGEGSVVMLNEFGTYVKDPSNGQPKKTSSKGILMRLNRKYSKAMALVMFHRRKQAGLVNRNRRTGDTSRRTNTVRTSEVD